MPNKNNDEKEKVIGFFSDLSNAVVHAIRGGTDEDRKRLITALEQMSAGMPAMTEEDANAKEFLLALISLLVGEPEPSDSLVEPYSEIYSHILEAVFARHHHHAHGDGHGGGHAHAHGDGHGHAHGDKAPTEEERDLQMKEFLTQLAATTVMVGKKGTGEEKKALAEKLGELRAAIPEEEKGPRALLAGFASILEGKPVSPDTMPGGYIKIYKKVLDEIGKG